jgi:O-antigen ligase
MAKLINTYLLFLLVGFPIISFIPINGVSVIFRAVMLIIGLVVGFCALVNMKGNANKKVIILFLFISVYFFKLYYDFVFTDLKFGRDNVEIFLLTLSTVIVPVFSLSFIDERNVNFRSLLIYSQIALMLSIVISVFLGLKNGFLYRLSGNDILNPISLGHYAVSCFVISLSFVLFSNEFNIGRFHRVLSIIAMPISMICLIMTASRGPMLSFVFLGLLFSILNSRDIVKTFCILAFGLASFFIALLFSEKFSNALLLRFTVDVDEDGGEARVFLWKLALEKFIESPIFGGHTTTNYGYVHNMFLEILMSMGVFAGVYYLLTCFGLYKKTVVLFRNSDVGLVFGFLFIQYFIASFFSGTVYSNDLVWVFMSILYLVRSQRKYV